MTKLSIDRNFNFDLLRLLCLFMVVIIHVAENTAESKSLYPYLLSVRSWGVPVLFLLSGFFFGIKANFSEISKLKKLLKKFSLLYIAGILFYFVVNFHLFQSNGFTFGLKYFISGQPIARHLWFLLSILIGYASIFIVFQLEIQKILNVTCLIFVFIGLLISPYPVLHNLFGDYYQNIALIFYPHFLSIPLIYLGYYIANSNKIRNVGLTISIIMIIIGLILIIIESSYLYKINLIGTFYFSTYILSIGFFYLALNSPIVKGRIFKFISYNIQKYASLVYIYHLFLIDKMSFISQNQFNLNIFWKISLESICILLLLFTFFAILNVMDKRILKLFDGSAIAWIFCKLSRRFDMRV